MVDKFTKSLTKKISKHQNTMNPDGFDQKAYANIKTMQSAAAGETGGKVVFVNG